MAIPESSVDVWVLTVCLNDRSGLARTLWSIDGQRGANVETVIADGGSTDGSLELALAYQRRHPATIVLPGPDGGIYQGMNRALNAAPEGSTVWFLNAGDFFCGPDSVQCTLDSLPGECPLAGGPIAVFGPSGRLDAVTAIPREARDGSHLPAQPSVIVAREAALAAGGFDETFRLASDGLLIARLVDLFGLSVYREPAVFFGLGGRSSANIRMTLSELRSDEAQASSRRLLDSWAIAKTSLRNRIFLAEVRFPLVKRAIGHLRGSGALAAKAHRWPHLYPHAVPVNCCALAAEGFARAIAPWGK